MTIQQILGALATVLALSVGQVLFKLASGKLDFAGQGFWASTLFNLPLMSALVVYGGATFAWLLVIKNVPLRTAYPFVALAFVIVPVFSYFFLDESLSVKTFIGAAFIIIGVCVSVI